MIRKLGLDRTLQGRSQVERRVRDIMAPIGWPELAAAPVWPGGSPSREEADDGSTAGRQGGRATAERFAEEGAKVVVADIDATAGEAAAHSARTGAANSGGAAQFLRCDVTERTSVEAAIAETVTRYGKLDILHNDAGGSTLQDGPVTEAADEEFWRVIRLDLYGTFLCSKIAIPEIIRAGGGAVINMSSNVALMALPGRDGYTAAKASPPCPGPWPSNMPRTRSV